MSAPGIAEYSRTAMKKTHDPSITIEEYFHYAKLTREREARLPIVSHPIKKVLGFGKKDEIVATDGRRMSVNMPSTEPTLDEKKTASGNSSPPNDFAVVTDEEWAQAARAARTATWGAIFYLITTDVLGPYSVP